MGERAITDDTGLVLRTQGCCGRGEVEVTAKPYRRRRARILIYRLCAILTDTDI